MRVLKDFAVYLDNMSEARHEQLLAYAATLCQRWRAHLIVAYAPEDLSLDHRTGFARGAAIKNMFEAYNERRRKSETTLREITENLNRQFEIACELRICERETGEQLMLHARHASLAILGAERTPDRQVSTLTLSEDVIFASGRPSILLPPEWPANRAPSRIVVGWNASREAARAISDAMPLLSEAQEVHIVVVPEPKIVRLLGQDPGADISRHLARYGIAVTLHCLVGDDAGDLLLAKAAELGADMIVMGAYGQPKISEFVFGSATQTILSASQLPILLSR